MSKTFLPKKTLIFLIGHFRRLFISALHLLTHLFSSSSLPFPFQFPDPEPFSSLQTMHVLGSSCLKCVHLLSPYFNLHATLSLWLRHPHILLSFSPSDFILSFHSPPPPALMHSTVFCLIPYICSSAPISLLFATLDVLALDTLDFRSVCCSRLIPFLNPPLSSSFPLPFSLFPSLRPLFTRKARLKI